MIVYYLLNPDIILRNEKDYFDTFIAYNYKTSSMKYYTEIAFKLLEFISNESKSIEEIENYIKDLDSFSREQIQNFFSAQIQSGIISTSNFRKKNTQIDYIKPISNNNFEVPYLSTPATIDLFITSKCNLNCAHCFVKEPRKITQTELALNILTRLIDEMERMRVLEVRITGGEPTLHPNINEFLAYLSKKHIRSVILTNGIDIKEEIIKKLKNYHILPTISLDSSEAEIYDEFRGVQGAFKKVIKTFELINEYKVDFGINCCVMKRNLNKLKDITKVAIDYKAKKITFLDIIPTKKQYLQSEWGLSFREYQNILKYKKELVHEFKNKIEIVFIMGTCLEFSEMENIRNEFVICPAGIRTLSIFSNGCVYSCNVPIGLEEFYVGNIYDQSLLEIWHNERWRKFRGGTTYTQLKDCFNCEKFIDCKDKHCRALPYIILGDFYGPHPKCVLE